MSKKALGLILVTALVSVTLVTSNVRAQEEAAPDKTKSAAAKGEKEKKRTKIDFEDELVEGELKKPELFYLLQKKQFNFKRLIKLREDFLPEMRRDADEVRRQRSK